MDIELTGNYPIIIDGAETGRIDVSREGLFWCFDATSDMADGIIRLSVFGDEGEGYLGVMEPKNNRLGLRKRLSRSALKGFPRAITHGGKHGEPQMSRSSDIAVDATETHIGADISSAPDAEPSDADGSELQQIVRPPPDEAANPEASGEAASTVSPDIAEKISGSWELDPPEADIPGESEAPVAADIPGELNLPVAANTSGKLHPPVSDIPEDLEPPEAADIPEEIAVAEAAGAPETAEAPPSADLPEDAIPPLPSPLVWRMCGCPASHLSTLQGKNIFGGRKDVLEAKYGGFVYLALPERDAEIYPEQQRMFIGRAVIMGETYLICKTNNGKII